MEPTNWHRRQAMNIASQLPEEPEDAWAILSCVEQLIAFFEGPPPPEEPETTGQAVVRFPGGPSSPRRRARATGKPSAFPK
jgi:hypothetical protein